MQLEGKIALVTGASRGIGKLSQWRWQLQELMSLSIMPVTKLLLKQWLLKSKLWDAKFCCCRVTLPSLKSALK